MLQRSALTTVRGPKSRVLKHICAPHVWYGMVWQPAFILYYIILYYIIFICYFMRLWEIKMLVVWYAMAV